MTSWSCVYYCDLHIYIDSIVYTKCDIIPNKILYYPFYVWNILIFIYRLSKLVECAVLKAVRDISYQYITMRGDGMVILYFPNVCFHNELIIPTTNFTSL